MVGKPPAEIGMAIDDVDTPALLIDLDAFESNIDTMAKATAKFPIKLRPHAKTHKCPTIALRQIAAGAVGVCCQKVSEAEALVYHGVKNVLVSNEIVSMQKLMRLAALAKEACITVCVDHAANVAQINEAARRLGVTLCVLVEVDVGAHKCGVAPGDMVPALAQLIASSPHLRFGGLQVYHGAAQHIREHHKRKEAIDQAILKVKAAISLLERNGFGCELVSGGGTGSYMFEAASGVYNEIQAGSYIFMDADYSRNFNAKDVYTSEFAQSLFVLATVMSRPTPERAIVDAGIKALSVDSGLPVLVGKRGIEYVGAADEHGKLAIWDSVSTIEVGEKVRLIPGHCDPTVNLHDWFICCRDGKVEAIWPITARGPGL